MPSFNIKQKFVIIGLISTISVLGIIAFNKQSTEQLLYLEKIRSQISSIEEAVLTLRRKEKDFLARKEQKYLDEFAHESDHLQSQLLTLRSNLDAIAVANPSVAELAILLKEYENTFRQLTRQQKKIGLGPTKGLYGSLRQAVHLAEESIRNNNDQRLLADMLTLRRNEKDFMLRHDMQYVKRLQKNFAVMQTDLDISNTDVQTKQQIRQHLRRYHADFMALVEASQVRGLTHHDGMMGKMRAAFHKAEVMLLKMTRQLDIRISAAEAYLHNSNNIFSLLFVGAIIVLLSWFAFSILNPLQQQIAVIKRICAENNLDIRMDDTRSDEIGDVATSFNKLLDNFQRIVNSIRSSAGKMKSTADELSAISAGTVLSAKQQASQTEQVTQAMNEMFSSAQDVASESVSAAATVTAANHDIHTGQQVINIAVDAVNSLSTEIDQASKRINKLAEDSMSIGAVVEVIRDITEQTNLLALNAAIEASRAGEHGRGFAVVADEVRSLASRTHDSTQEIQKMIEQLQDGTRAAVEAMEASCNQSRLGVEKITAAGIALNAVIKDIQKINNMNQKIARAAEAQSTVTGQISSNVSEINIIVTATTRHTEKTSRASEELGQLSLVMNQLVSQFKT